MRADGTVIADLTAELEKLHAASFGWAMSCCRRDQTAAEEVLQTVYLKIIEGTARFRGEASFQTWLFAVIRKTAISEHRRSRLWQLRDVALRSSSNQSRTGVETPDAVFEKSEAQVRFQKALRTLPTRQREALHLVFYEDLSLSEAAFVMGISIGSARQHYERGKRRLRRVIEQTESDYGIHWRRKENPGAI